MDKLIVMFSVSLFLVAMVVVIRTNTSENDQFQEWKRYHNKIYSIFEEQYRMKIFVENLKIIQEHNSNINKTYIMGYNKFMDLSKEEFIHLYLNPSENLEEIQIIDKNNSKLKEIPKSVDWRGLTKMGDQGTCSSGWAFAATAAVEAHYNIFSGIKNMKLSEQQLIDCGTSDGCQRGYANLALNQIKRFGSVTEAEYPYKGILQNCQIIGGNIYIKGYIQVDRFIEYMQEAVAIQPVTAAVDASNWMFYQSGVFSDCLSSSTNHYVLNVGYDEDGNWFVKNSWGSDWGDNGHITLGSGNTCSILGWAHKILE